MLTLGVDLATELARTAACLIEWKRGNSAIRDLIQPATDADIVALGQDAAAIGIDAPFGWPQAWAHAVASHRPGARFTADGPIAHLTRRATDQWIIQTVSVYPLSVAANLIGATAIRCARLLSLLPQHVDTGVGLEPPVICEVYPAAALVRWQHSHKLYKGNKLVEGRSKLIASLTQAGWPVPLNDRHRAMLERSDDVLDSVLASLVARAAVLGLTEDAPVELRELAALEGWIRVPRVGSTLADLR